MQTNLRRMAWSLCGLLFSLSVATAQTPLGTEWTYQGVIEDNGVAVNGTMDFRFRLFNAETLGAQVGTDQFIEDVPVVDGLFTVEIDFGGVFNGDQRWLAIGVRDGALMDPDPYTQLSPRQPLTAAPYARTAVSALSAEAVVGVDGHSLNAADNTPPDAVFVDNNGNVGVGTMTPAESFHLSRDAGTPAIRVENTTSGAAAYRLANLDQTYDLRITNTEKLVLRDVTAGNVDRLVIDTTGNIGIGTANPETPLSIVNGGSPVGITQGQLGTSAMELTTRDSSGGQPTRVKINAGVDSPDIEFYSGARGAEAKFGVLDSTANGGRMQLFEPGGDQRIMASVNAVDCGDIQLDGPNGNVNVWMTNLAGSPDHGWMGVFDSTGTVQAGMYVEADGDGRMFAGIVQINGGSDIAEPFNIHDHEGAQVSCEGDEAVSAGVQPGMVVSIDAANPGELRLASRAYDSAVAGIISGAGGVQPGMTLQQPGTIADGKHPVAMTGRVWCRVDAEANGPVQPGDLLTSSDTPGHAMKATDRDRAFGTCIGKAMTALDNGRGLVLVLVNLQ